jgi:undecaprenyl-diphosphatase
VGCSFPGAGKHGTSDVVARSRQVAAGSLVSLASAFAFVWLAMTVAHPGRVVLVDHAVAVWTAAHRSVVEGQAGLMLATATGPVVLAAITALISGGLWRRGRQAAALMLGVAVAAAFGIGGLIKTFDHRDRPRAPINLAPESEGSFPSGHVLVLGTLVGVVLVLVWPLLTRTARWTVTPTAVTGVVLVSLDRLVVGAHWLSDVVASLALAVTIVATAATFAAARPPRRLGG